MAGNIIKAGGQAPPPRIILYGPPKVGKSTLGTTAPKPLFICTEEGVDGIKVDRFAKADNWAGFLQNCDDAVKTDGYKTVVIDTVNGAAELAAQHVCSTMFKGNWGPGGFQSFGQGWAAVSEEFRKLLIKLDGLRASGKMCLMLAHTGIVGVKNPIDGDYTRFAPDLDKRVWARVAAWADIIGRIDYDYAVIKDDKAQRGRAVGTTSRIIRFAGSAAEDAGCRVGYELPDTLPLSWPEIESHLGKGVNVIDEVLAGWDSLGEEEQKKALAWAGVKKIEDAPKEKLAVIANKLRTRKEKR